MWLISKIEHLDFFMGSFLFAYLVPCDFSFVPCIKKSNTADLSLNISLTTSCSGVAFPLQQRCTTLTAYNSLLNKHSMIYCCEN